MKNRKPDYRLLEEGLLKKIEDNKGVYTIFASTSLKTFDAATIERIGGVDKEGILYIGQGVMRHRLKNFLEYVKVIGKDEKRDFHHSGGKRYHAAVTKNKNIKKIFPPEKLWVSLDKSNDSEKEENKRLKQYFYEFGEVPPFNATVNVTRIEK